MATSFPCTFQGKSCMYCKDFAECQKTQGKPFRKWEKANTIINNYPDGSFELIRYKHDFDYMYEAGNLPSKDRVRKMIKEGAYWTPVDGFDVADIQASIASSSKRSKDTMYGYVLSNDWQYWVSLTLSPKEVDRYDDDAVKALWRRFQRICKYNNPDCKILVIPERHKDGALHFHALMSDIDLNLSPAVDKNGKLKKDSFGNPTFNVNSWDFGFSTAAIIPPDNNNLRVANYLVKYITKDGNIDYNAKRYYHTLNLEFKNKVISYLSEEEFAKSEFKEGLKKIKDNEKMEVYFYSVQKKGNKLCVKDSLK